jgi:hypothetical protein
MVRSTRRVARRSRAMAVGDGGIRLRVLRPRGVRRGWRRLLSDAGVRVGLWPLARIFLVSNLGRYLPGGRRGRWVSLR